MDAVDQPDPFDIDLEQRLHVHMATMKANDPYDYEEDRLAIHMANTAAVVDITDDAPNTQARQSSTHCKGTEEDEEDSRFRIHMAVHHDDADEDEEESRFRIHMATERLSGQIADVSLDPHDDEDSRFAAHTSEQSRSGGTGGVGNVSVNFEPPQPSSPLATSAATSVPKLVPAPASTLSPPALPPPRSEEQAAAAADATLSPSVSSAAAEGTAQPPAPSASSYQGKQPIPVPLKEAIRADDTVAVGSMLLTDPSLVKSVDDRGRSPVWLAAYHKSCWVLTRLLNANGTDVDGCDYEGTTPLHAACWRHGDLRVITALRNRGADIRRQPWAGGLRNRNALSIATYYKRRPEVLKLLKPRPKEGTANAAVTKPAQGDEQGGGAVTAQGSDGPATTTGGKGTVEATVVPAPPSAGSRQVPSLGLAIELEAGQERDGDDEQGEHEEDYGHGGGGSSELRTRKAVPLWVGPGGSLLEVGKLSGTAQHADEEEASEQSMRELEQRKRAQPLQWQQQRRRQQPQQPVGVASPSRGKGRASAATQQSRSATAYEYQMLTRSYAWETRHGVSSTRVDQQRQQDPDGEPQRQERHGHGGVGSAVRGQTSAAGSAVHGVESASAALMEVLAQSASRSANRVTTAAQRREEEEFRSREERSSRNLPRLSGDADADPEGACLTTALPPDLQREVLALLPLELAGGAARVCSTWRDLLAEDGVWKVLCERAGYERETTEAEIADAVAVEASWSRLSAPRGWRATGIGMHEAKRALSSRWRRGECLEDTLYLHTDQIMSLHLHKRRLISCSCDHTLRVIDVAGSLLRDEADERLRGSSGMRSFVPSGACTLAAHSDQVFHMHACDAWAGWRESAAEGACGLFGVVAGGNDVDMVAGERVEDDEDTSIVASTSADGVCCIWSVSGRGGPAPDVHSGEEEEGERPGRQRSAPLHGALLRRWHKWDASCVQMDAWRVTCGGEGARPIITYDWRDGEVLQAYTDAEPPLGVCSSLHHAGPLLAAGNTYSLSQLRVWDLETAALLDRFSLPAACRGVRCLQLLPEEHALVAGCANGWIVWCDLRCGRFEKKMGHADCVNSVSVKGEVMLTAADDGLVRLSDTRTFGSIHSHRLRKSASAAVSDEGRIFAGCDDGTVHMFDYSAAAAVRMKTRDQGSGGFSDAQKQALAAAVESARRRAAENAFAERYGGGADS